MVELSTVNRTVAGSSPAVPANTLDEKERLLVQRSIAALIDSPSVFMGGPSKNSMNKADRIIRELEHGKRLVPTTCDHTGWKNYRQNGTYCPDCGTILDKEPPE